MTGLTWVSVNIKQVLFPTDCVGCNGDIYSWKGKIVTDIWVRSQEYSGSQTVSGEKEIRHKQYHQECGDDRRLLEGVKDED